MRGLYGTTLITGTLMICGAVEAVWGICQLYGFAASQHALYALTGSFYNPGPYSGFLALMLPLCLHEWLERKKSIDGYAALAVMALILTVLPAGMSRTAWMAAAISSGYVYGMHRREAIKDYIHRHRKGGMGLAVMGCLLGGMALGGAYQLKKDSADGRLFLWKIAARAVCEQPWTGYGWNHVPAAYGEAQEAYFAAGDYTPTEEHMAGAPEYVFNEYLQVALAWGIPALCLGLLIIGGGFYIGHRKGAYGLCGGLLSFAVFSFASYPLQFPLFVAALGILLLGCYAQVVPISKLLFGIAVIALAGYAFLYHYKHIDRSTETYRQWQNSRMLYRSAAYTQAVEGFASLHEALRTDANYLFEYGHALHKLDRPEASNRILKEALQVSSDPMVLNIIGKNHHALGNHAEAEHWLIRSTHRLPGRIYPYYLLACLYADSAYYQREKLERMVRIVQEKEPKVKSTAIREMRQKATALLIPPFVPSCHSER